MATNSQLNYILFDLFSQHILTFLIFEVFSCRIGENKMKIICEEKREKHMDFKENRRY